jgi:hypothetical protein
MKNVLCREPGCDEPATDISIAKLPTGGVEAIAGAWCKAHAELNALIHETEERLKLEPKVGSAWGSGSFEALNAVFKQKYDDGIEAITMAKTPFFGLIPKK